MKYISVEDYVNVYAAEPAVIPITRKQVLDDLKNMPPADVIPVAWITEWYKKHYHTDSAALIEDWRKANQT